MFHLGFLLFEEASELNAGGGGAEGIGTEHTASAPQQPLTLESLLSAFQDFSTKLPDTIKASVSKEVNGLDARLDRRLKALEKAATPTAPKVDPKPLNNDFLTQKEQEWAERFRALEEKDKERDRVAQQMQLEGEVKSALSEFPWLANNGKSEGKEIAFDYYMAKAKRNDEGELVIADVPLSKYIRQHAAAYFKNYFAPREVGGSGAARAGSQKGGVDLDNIRPGMSAEEDAATKAALISVLGAIRR